MDKVTAPYLIDSHTHLDSTEFDEDREAVIERAAEAGVTKIINIGATDGFDGAERSIELADKYDNIWITVGIHPHDATTTHDIARLLHLCSHEKCVGIGETGLDFYRDWSPEELQYLWFRTQVEIALEVKKPIVIHSREAHEQCLQVLTEMEAAEVGGVFHCYPADADFAVKLKEINFLVSFPGIITFPKAESVREAAKAIPLEQIMVETDAPYLAPTPYRGKRCESAYTRETALKLAEVKGIGLEDVARGTSENAEKLFKLPKEH